MRRVHLDRVARVHPRTSCCVALATRAVQKMVCGESVKGGRNMYVAQINFVATRSVSVRLDFVSVGMFVSTQAPTPNIVANAIKSVLPGRVVREGSVSISVLPTHRRSVVIRVWRSIPTPFIVVNVIRLVRTEPFVGPGNARVRLVRRSVMGCVSIFASIHVTVEGVVKPVRTAKYVLLELVSRPAQRVPPRAVTVPARTPITILFIVESVVTPVRQTNSVVKEAVSAL